MNSKKKTNKLKSLKWNSWIRIISKTLTECYIIKIFFMFQKSSKQNLLVNITSNH